MACFSETASDALEHHHREREEKALNLIDYLADLTNNESLHDIKGNEDILRRKRLALHSGNSTTHAEIAAYDADYEESRICAIIRHITPKTFSEHIMPQLSHSKEARDLLTWWERHKEDDRKRIQKEIKSVESSIYNLEAQMTIAQNKLKLLKDELRQVS